MHIRSLSHLALVTVAALILSAMPGVATARAINANAPQLAGAPNVRVSRDSYPYHGEPSIAVNPRDPRNLLGASMFISGHATLLGTFASFDGGQTWHDNGTLPLPRGMAYGDDVTAAFDAQGSGFICAMATSGLQRQDRNVFVWRTDDGGRTFRRAVAAMSHQFADHPWLAASTTLGTTAADLYAAWVAQDHSALGVTYSRDGGRTFAAPHNIAVQGGVAIPVVAAGPAGAVYVVYESSRQGADAPSESDALDAQRRTEPARSAAHLRAHNSVPLDAADAQIEVISSADRGRSFGAPVALGAVPSQPEPTPGVLLPTGPSVAVDPRSGAVYVAYIAYRSGTNRLDVLIARSQDGGHTWSHPVRVTNVPAADPTAYFQPQVVVDSAGGVDVTFFALAHGRVDVLLARSTTRGTAFSAPMRITSRSFDPTRGPFGGGKHGRWWIGDYQGLAAGGGAIHPFWNDTRDGGLQIYTAAIAAH